MPPSRKWFAAESIRFSATTTDVSLITRPGVLYGWSFEETTAAAGAKFELDDGSSSNAQGIVSITLLANESTRDLMGRPGIWCDGGIFVHMFSGSIRGNIYYQSLTDDEIIEMLNLQYPGSTA